MKPRQSTEHDLDLTALLTLGNVQGTARLADVTAHEGIAISLLGALSAPLVPAGTSRR